MAQVIIRRSSADIPGLPRTLLDRHADFLGRWRDALVTYGPIWRPVEGKGGGSDAGYIYQTDLPGNAPEAVAQFMAEDPLAAAGVFTTDEVSDWHCALATRLPTAPVRPGMKGFFFHGIGKPNITEFRNTILDAHRAHLQQRDASNCLSRGFLTDAGGKAWLGSAMVYEFPDRAALEDYFRTEPYCTNGIYERIDLYDWQRGVIAG